MNSPNGNNNLHQGDSAAGGGTFALQVSQSSSPSTEQTKKHINALPLVPLGIIFSYLPLQDVLQMHLVCLAWKSFQEDIVSKINSITLLIGEQATMTICTNDPFCYKYVYNPTMEKLTNDDGTALFPKRPINDKYFRVSYSSLSIETVHFLTRTLANIVHLQIKLNEISYEVIDEVILLIQAWSSKLGTLKLWCCFSEQDCHPLTNKAIQVLASIDTLPMLDHLTVEFANLLYLPYAVGRYRAVNDDYLGVEPHFELSILSRLRQFYFTSYDVIQRTPLFYSLKQYVPLNPHLIHIGLGNHCNHRPMMDFAQDFPNVVSRIVSLMDRESVTFRPNFVGFTSLTELSLDYRITTRKFSQLINSLSSLDKLVHLQLVLDFVYPRLGIPFSVDDCAECSPQSGISQLTTVKMLSVNVHANSQTDLDSIHWAWVFPNVQVLEFMLEYNPPSMVPKMLPTFMQCPLLSTIFSIIYQEDQENGWQEWTIVETDGQKSLRMVVKS